MPPIYNDEISSKMVGALVRKSAGMFGFNLKEKNNNFVISSIYSSYKQAGRELATLGKISKSTEKKANEPMVKVPFFIKPMLKFGFGREKIAEAHTKMMQFIIKRV